MNRHSVKAGDTETRLLSINNYNENIENEFLKRLTQVMGEQQIIRIKGMINDISNSKKVTTDMTTHITKRREKYPSIKTDVFSVYLLTNSSWPKEALETETCLLPDELKLYTTAFHDYFEAQNPGQTKVAEWLLEEGYVEISANLGGSRKVLIMSVPQYSILSALHSAPDMKLMFHEIKSLTKVKKILSALAPMVNKKLINRENADVKQKIDESEFLSINKSFPSKTREVNFLVRKTLKNRGGEADKSNIDEFRKMMIESAVVRIMKSHKVCRFQELANDVRKTLQDHFQPPDTLLRVMIDDLIRREFLERDDNDLNVYKYKA